MACYFPGGTTNFKEILNLNVTIFIHITVSQRYEGISDIYYEQFQPEPHPRL